MVTWLLELARLTRATIESFIEDDCPTLAAAVSFYTIFSLPPLLLTTVFIVGTILGRRTTEAHLIEEVQALIGPSAAAQVQTMLTQAGNAISGGGLSLAISVGTLVFAATGLLVQLQRALNKACNVEPNPSRAMAHVFLAKRLISFAAILAVAFLLLVSLALSAAISAFGEQFVALAPQPISMVLLQGLELGASVVVFTLVFAGMLRYLPDGRLHWNDVWAAGLGIAVAVVAGKFALSLYLGNSNVVSYFGAAGSLAVVMVWVYFASLTLLMGAEFARARARSKGRPIQPRPGAVLRNPMAPVKT